MPRTGCERLEWHARLFAMRWGPLLLGVLGTAASYSPRVSSGRPGQRAALRSLREHSTARTQGQTNRAVARASNPRLVLLDQPELLTPVLEAVDEFFRQSPVTAAAMTCGAKAAASDSITQKRANLLEVPFCWSRNRAFMIYGAIYQGCVQHFLYNDFYVRLFGDSTSVGTVLEKVAFDNLVRAPEPARSTHALRTSGTHTVPTPGAHRGVSWEAVTTLAFAHSARRHRPPQVHVPLLCLPTLYLLKAAIFEQPLADGLQRYVPDAMGPPRVTAA